MDTKKSERLKEKSYNLKDVICDSCSGEGYRMSCPDDICRATGECRHGNGYSKCYDCDGNGYLTIDMNTNKIVDWNDPLY